MQSIFPIHFLNDEQTHFLSISRDEVSFSAPGESVPLIVISRSDLQHVISEDAVTFEFNQKQVKFITSFARSLRNVLYFNVSAPIQYGCLIDDSSSQLVLAASHLKIFKTDELVAQCRYQLINIYTDGRFLCIYNNAAENTSLVAKLEFATESLAREIKDFATFLEKEKAPEPPIQVSISLPNTELMANSFLKSQDLSGSERSVAGYKEESVHSDAPVHEPQNSQQLSCISAGEPQHVEPTERSELESSISIMSPPPNPEEKPDSEAASYFNSRHTFMSLDNSEVELEFSYKSGQLICLPCHVRTQAVVRGIKVVDIIQKVCIVCFTLNDVDLLLMCGKKQAQEMMAHYKSLFPQNCRPAALKTLKMAQDVSEPLNGEYDAIDSDNRPFTLILRCLDGAVSWVEADQCAQRSYAVYQITFVRENDAFHRLYVRTERECTLLWLEAAQAKRIVWAWLSLHQGR